MIELKEIRTAKIRVAIELLPSLLLLPKHMRAINVMTDVHDCGVPRDLLIYIESPHLHEVDDGTSAPTIMPVYGREASVVRLLRIDGYDGPLDG